ncbi:MAG: HpcH/HpaI aldolase/citrate lyase family protein [bacterium]
MSSLNRPRRSCLYMPGANERALKKARTLPADVVIFDLEDAVAPDSKQQARDNIAEAVRQGGYGASEIVIRINALDTPWGEDDLAMAVSANPDGILVPKVISGAMVREIDQALSNAGAEPDLALWANIEMPLAILNIKEIAEASGDSRLKGFVMGTNDLCKEMNAINKPGREALLTALFMTNAAAKSCGLFAIDAVFNSFRDMDGLRAECQQARMFGFDGKSLIHPAQLDTANDVFSPNPDDVAQARAIIDAFALPENQNKGAIKVNGEMVELLHCEQAQRLVDIDRAIRHSGCD